MYFALTILANHKEPVVTRAEHKPGPLITLQNLTRCLEKHQRLTLKLKSMCELNFCIRLIWGHELQQMLFESAITKEQKCHKFWEIEHQTQDLWKPVLFSVLFSCRKCFVSHLFFQLLLHKTAAVIFNTTAEKRRSNIKTHFFNKNCIFLSSQ